MSGKFYMGQKFDVSKDAPALEGVIVDVDITTGKARSIERVRERD